MDCRETLASLADLSADCLSNPECAAELRRHLETCPPCKTEWERFQGTLLTLSVTTQPLSSRTQAQAMWGVCLEQIFEEAERKRIGSSPSRSTLLNWLAIQPRWSWVALGGAMAVLGGVWVFGPHSDPPLNDTPSQYQAAHVISFERPPAAAYSMIGGHAEMSFDGFNDHVGSTLVSLTATEPLGPGESGRGADSASR